MKFFLCLLLAGAPLLSAIPRHEVVFVGGGTATGRVIEIKNDTLRYQPEATQDTLDISLDTVLYVHNNNGKLFYVSEKLKKFVEKGVGRGGMIVTTDGKELRYSRLEEEVFMYKPRLIYYSSDTSRRQSVRLEKIHKVIIDHTLSEYAVKKGFVAGMGLTAFGLLVKFKSLKQFLNFSKVLGSVLEIYPNAVTVTPLTTLGWVVYDFFKGERELIVNPSRIQ